jgi:hypothetical protein
MRARRCAAFRAAPCSRAAPPPAAQAGNNVMLVMPNSAADLAGGAVVAESSWTGAPTGLTLQSEARIMQRLQAAETITRQAEAAAQAAGLVAQSVMGELIIAREEAAVALRFIKGARAPPANPCDVTARKLRARLRLKWHAPAGGRIARRLSAGARRGCALTCAAAWSRREGSGARVRGPGGRGRHAPPE